eukprot:9051142-Pyramimonas_sp.AAC.1
MAKNLFAGIALDISNGPSPSKPNVRMHKGTDGGPLRWHRVSSSQRPGLPKILGRYDCDEAFFRSAFAAA